MLKKIILSFLIAFSSSQLVQAKVIELNNLNPDNCRQAILGAGSTRPIIFMYMDGCPWADKLRPLYEQVSDENPDRPFFAFKFYDENHNDYQIAQTAQACFGTFPSRSPSVFIYNVMPSGPKFSGYFIGIDKMGLDGGSTKEDILQFLDLGISNKSNSYTLFKDH